MREHEPMTSVVSDLPLLSAYQERLLEGPDGAYDRTELRERLLSALGELRPREAVVLRLRYGLDDGDEHTLGEVGTAFDLSRERVRQIQLNALRKLRHPDRANVLRTFHSSLETNRG